MNKSSLIASTLTILFVLGIVVYRLLWVGLVPQDSTGRQNYLRAGTLALFDQRNDVTTPASKSPQSQNSRFRTCSETQA
jgi:hypothetical protein